MEEQVNKNSGTYISKNIGMIPSEIQSNFRKVSGMEPIEMAFWAVNTGLLVLITLKEFRFL
jgi:hypothetical protein